MGEMEKPEVWDVYDKNWKKTKETMIRGTEPPKGCYHLVVEIIVRHEDGSFLLTQRDWNKPSYPGLYECSAGGSVLAGEKAKDAAIRELWEETGIKASHLREIYEEYGVSALHKGYLCCYHGDKSAIHLQETETISYCWLEPEQLLSFIEGDLFVPAQRERMKPYLENVRREVRARSYQITNWIWQFVKAQVQKGDLCIDATAGNGNDTCLLSHLAGMEGKVLAFDIQPDALAQTKKRLEQKGERAELILDSHANMEQYVKAETVSCIMFNFGYLPGGDHNIQTKAQSSIQAIAAGLRLLMPGGLMTLCIYSGKDSGYEERDALLSYIKALDAREYVVIVSHYENRPNDPPIPVLIRKL